MGSPGLMGIKTEPPVKAFVAEILFIDEKQIQLMSNNRINPA